MQSLQTPPTPSFLPSFLPSLTSRHFLSIPSFPHNPGTPHHPLTSPQLLPMLCESSSTDSATPPPCLPSFCALWLGGFYCAVLCYAVLCCAVPKGEESTCGGVLGAVAGWVCCGVWSVVVRWNWQGWWEWVVAGGCRCGGDGREEGVRRWSGCREG